MEKVAQFAGPGRAGFLERVRHKPKPPSAAPVCLPPSPSSLTQSFSFCTGIENSAPVIKDGDGKPCRIDQMVASGHDRRWREDFQLVHALGLRCLR
jgi:hypothetical protein